MSALIKTHKLFVNLEKGTLDDAEWFQPQRDVWASSHLSSMPINLDVKDFTVMPTARAKK